jgi:PadR family transcriptional regulator PadR
MNASSLGEMEHLVMLAILRLGDRAYGIPVIEEVRARTGRRVSRASVYVALRRLEQKGLVTSRLGASTPERGGRAKRYFRLRASALRALRASRAAYVNMWRDYEAILDGV